MALVKVCATVKRMMLYTLLFLVVASLPLSSQESAQPENQRLSQTFLTGKAHIELTPEGVLHYQGKITFFHYESLVSLYKAAKNKPSHLSIKSLGGDGLAAIMLGHFIHQEGLSLTINDYCMSSCANFVFTASPHVTLSSNTLVVFHGSFYQENITAKLTLWYKNELAQKEHSDLQKHHETSIQPLNNKEQTLALKYYPNYHQACAIESLQVNNHNSPDEMAKTCTEYLRDIESRFFTTVPVDSHITTLGQSGGYESIYKAYQYLGFYYPIEDLKTLGVKNISIMENKTWEPYSNPYYSKVYPVSLANIK